MWDLQIYAYGAFTGVCQYSYLYLFSFVPLGLQLIIYI